MGCKWVCKTKRNLDGSVQKLRARLVAKSFPQNHGTDFKETFRPVVTASTVRIILTLTAACDWKVRQLNINNAFEITI